MLRPLIFGLSAFFLTGLAWLFAKQALFTWWYTGSAPVMAEAVDYADPLSWAVRPAASPASVWEVGWRVDVMLLPSWPKAWHKTGDIPPMDMDYGLEQADALAAVLPALRQLGPVYAPRLRMPSPVSADPDWGAAAEDFAAAMDHYYLNENRGRGILLAVPGETLGLAPLAIEALEARQPLEKQRIAGVIILADRDGPIPEFPCPFGPDMACPTVIDMPESPPALAWFGAMPPGGAHPRVPGNPDALEGKLAVTRAYYLDWLEKNAAKQAEPFGGFEVIDVAPISRPDGSRVE